MTHTAFTPGIRPDLTGHETLEHTAISSEDASMNLAYDQSADTGPAVVCLPMFSMSRTATATAFSPALAGAGLREIYLDLPGHGDTPAHCPPTSQSVLDTVCAWLDHNLDAPVLLAGGSYGAYLAAGIARQRPDLVAGLLLVCPGVTIARHSRNLPDEPPLEDPRPGSTPLPPPCTHTSTPPWATAPQPSSRRSSPP